MANNAYQLYTISEVGVLCRHVSDVTPAPGTFRSREAWVGSGGSKERCSSRTFSTIPDPIYRLDTQASRSKSSSSATLQYNSLKKQNGGPVIEKGELAPIIRTQALVQIPVTKSQTNQKYGTRSLPNSSLQEAVEPLPRHATSATGRKDPGIAKQTTQGVKVPLPKINNLVNGELTSVVHNQDHGYRMPAPAGVPTTRNVVLFAGDKPTRHTPLVTPLPEWLQEPRQEHRMTEKHKNELNRSSRTDHPKPWLQVIPKKTQETGTGNKRNGAPPRVGVFHAPELHQKTDSEIEEEERRKPEAKAKDRSFKSPEKSQTGKTSKDWEKKEGRKESPERQKDYQRTFGAQPRTRLKKAARARKRPVYKPDTGSSTETDDISSSDDEGLFSFVKRKPAQDVTSSPRRDEGKKGVSEAKKSTEEEKKRYTIQDAVSVYKRDYMRVKGKHRSLLEGGRSRRRHQAVQTQSSPRSRSKERILTRREATIYQNMSKAYATDEVQRRRENQFYKRLLELQMKKWHEEYREHLKQQLHRLDKQQQQETQLMRVRRKFFEEQLKRWRTQYITGRVVTHEWANRSEYGLPEDDYTGNIQQEDRLYKKLKPKKFSFKKQYLRNKKKYNTIFKRRALFVNEGLKPPKMEGIDTVELDGSGSRNVKDVLKEAEDLLDETSDDSADISSSDDDTVGQSSDDNVHVQATSYKTTKPLPRKEGKLPEKKKKRVVVVPPPKKPATEWKKKQQPSKTKGEKATDVKQAASRKVPEKGDPVSREKRPIQGPAPRYQSQFANWKMLPSDGEEDDSGDDTSLETKPKSSPTSTMDDVDKDKSGKPSTAQKTETKVKVKPPLMLADADDDESQVKPRVRKTETTSTMDNADEDESEERPTRQESESPLPVAEGDSRETSPDGEDAGTGQKKARQQNDDGEQMKDAHGKQEGVLPVTGHVTMPRTYDDGTIRDGKQPEIQDQSKVSGLPHATKLSPSTNKTELDGRGKAIHDKDAKKANTGPIDGESGSNKPDLAKVDSEGRGTGTKDDVSKDEKDKRQTDPERRTSETTSDSKEEGSSGIKEDPVRIDPDKRQSPLNDTRTDGNKEQIIPEDKDNKPAKPSAQKQTAEKQKSLPKDADFRPKDKEAKSETESGTDKSSEPSSKVPDAKQANTVPSKDLPTPEAKQTKAGKTNEVRPEQKGDKTGKYDDVKTDSHPSKRTDIKGAKRDTTSSLPTKAADGKQVRLDGGDDVPAKPGFEQSKIGRTDNIPSKSTGITPMKSEEKGNVSSKSREVKQDKTDIPKSHLADKGKKSDDVAPKSTGARHENLLPNGDLPPKRGGAKQPKSSAGKNDQSAKTASGKQQNKDHQRNEQRPIKPTDSKKTKNYAEDELNRGVKANDSKHPNVDKRGQKPESKRTKSHETVQPKESSDPNLKKRPEQRGKKETKSPKDEKKSKTKQKHDNGPARGNQGKPRSPRPATRESPRTVRKSTPSKRGKQKDKGTKERTTARKRTPPSSKKDDDDFNISSYLEDRKWPNVYNVRLSDYDSSDSDEDIFEKAMRKYGIRVDDSD